MRPPLFPLTAEWLNTNQALAWPQLKGQVVVLDFWTYCCINCLHVLPDLAYLEKVFADQPVTVIGVHSAKFANEQKQENIILAVQRYDVRHPVVIDNDHQLWDEFAIKAWPTIVVVDAEGQIRGQVSGEGHRHELEQTIAFLLEEGREKGVLAEQSVMRAVVSLSELPPSVLRFPGKLCFDDQGRRLFISDTNHHRIMITRFISPTEVVIEAIVGSGVVGFKDGKGKEAAFSSPQGLCYSAGYLYICDTGNHALRQLEVGTSIDESAGSYEVTTLAGTGLQAEFKASGGESLATDLNSPWDVAYRDQYLLVAMAGSHQLWRYDFNTQLIEAYAGNGYENLVDGLRLTAQLAQPSGIAVVQNKVYFADSETSSIRVLDLDDQVVKTLVGQGLFVFGHQDGDADGALFQHPLGLCATSAELFIADTYNHAIRHLDLKTGMVSTLINRTEHAVCLIGDVSCELLPLAEPNDVKKLGDNLYLADTNNHLIRVYNLKTNLLETLAIRADTEDKNTSLGPQL